VEKNPPPGQLTIHARQKYLREMKIRSECTGTQRKDLDSLCEGMSSLWVGPDRPPSRASELSWVRTNYILEDTKGKDVPEEMPTALWLVAGGPEAFLKNRSSKWECLHVQPVECA
jgi:hypothetical protein